MTGLVEFVLARMAEDEEAAQALQSWSQNWEAERDEPRLEWIVGAPAGPIIVTGYVGNRDSQPVAAHIARWDPARVLAECDAKRRIVEAELLREVGPVSHYLDPVVHANIRRRTVTPALRALALPYADHKDYRAEWRP